MTSACPHVDDAAPYALGALSESELLAFGAHLDRCKVCSTRVAELRLVVDYLPSAVPQHQPPEHLRERLMAQVRSEAELLRAAGPDADRAAPAAEPRRWARWRLSLRPAPAAALASVLLALGLGAGVVLEGGEEAKTGARTVAAVVTAPGAPDAKADLHISESGSRLVVAGMPAPPRGRIYQVWLDHPNDGKMAEPTDVLFSTSKLGRASVDVPGNLEGVSTVLVTDEPDGGSDEPSSRPVITAQPS